MYDPSGSAQQQWDPGAQPPPHRGTSALAITGLVIGLVSLLLALVPIINNFAFLLALIGIGFGVAAVLVTSKRRPTRKGKGLAWAGTILSALAVVGVLASQAFYGSVLDEAMRELEAQPAAPVETGEPEADSSERPESDPNRDQDSAPSNGEGQQGGGSQQDQAWLRWGETARFPDKLEVEVTEPSLRTLSSSDAMFLQNPDIRTVAELELRIRNKTAEPIDTSLTGVRAQYGGQQVTEAEQVFTSEYDSLLDAPKLQPGKSTTFTLGFQVPESRLDQLTAEVTMDMGLDYDPVYFNKDGKR